MPTEYDFAEKLAFSRGVTEQTHPDTIRTLLGDSCATVRGTCVDMDKKGVDFIATLRHGAEINIDIKARLKGCSRYWRNGIDLALEIWSVRPQNGRRGKIGWTLDESKITDYTLHVFDRTDTDQAFLLPFQLLRMAFCRRFHEWKTSFGKPNDRDVQSSGAWTSECVFVPVSDVLTAITFEMQLTPRRKPLDAITPVTLLSQENVTDVTDLCDNSSKLANIQRPLF